jgi:hypothetical protein
MVVPFLFYNGFVQDLLQKATSVRTPLALAGLFAAIFFLLVRRILKNFRPTDPSAASSAELARITLKYLFILSLVAMVLGFIGFIIPSPSPPRPRLSPAETQASTLEDRIMVIRGSWEAARTSEADLQTVREEAPKLAAEMAAVSDYGLRPAWQILKYEYTIYAYTMAAATLSGTGVVEKKVKLDYISRGLEAGAKAAELTSSVKASPISSPELQSAVAYVIHEEVEERINYLAAICLCKKAETLGDPDLKRQAKERMAQVPPAFQQKYPPNRNPEFKHCLYD